MYTAGRGSGCSPGRSTRPSCRTSQCASGPRGTASARPSTEGRSARRASSGPSSRTTCTGTTTSGSTRRWATCCRSSSGRRGRPSRNRPNWCCQSSSLALVLKGSALNGVDGGAFEDERIDAIRMATRKTIRKVLNRRAWLNDLETGH